MDYAKAGSTGSAVIMKPKDEYLSISTTKSHLMQEVNPMHYKVPSSEVKHIKGGGL